MSWTVKLYEERPRVEGSSVLVLVKTAQMPFMSLEAALNNARFQSRFCALAYVVNCVEIMAVFRGGEATFLNHKLRDSLNQ